MHDANGQVSFWQRTCWFAIRAKARREPLAAKNVSSLGLEVFLPKLKVEGDPDYEARENGKPLFSGYFFARFCLEISLASVECSPGGIPFPWMTRSSKKFRSESKRTVLSESTARN